MVQLASSLLGLREGFEIARMIFDRRAEIAVEIGCNARELLGERGEFLLRVLAAAAGGFQRLFR